MLFTFMPFVFDAEFCKQSLAVLGHEKGILPAGRRVGQPPAKPATAERFTKTASDLSGSRRAKHPYCDRNAGIVLARIPRHGSLDPLPMRKAATC